MQLSEMHGTQDILMPQWLFRIINIHHRSDMLYQFGFDVFLE